jgi:hypothetical protein
LRHNARNLASDLVGDFFGKDRRGFQIVFPQARFDHALERGHFDRIKGTWGKVMAAFESSRLVLANPTLPNRHPDAPARHGQERYVSDPIEEFGGRLIVPVIVPVEPFSLPSGVTVDPPVRVAWTAYVGDKIPDGEEVWRCPPDPKS